MDVRRLLAVEHVALHVDIALAVVALEHRVLVAALQVRDLRERHLAPVPRGERQVADVAERAPLGPGLRSSTSTERRFSRTWVAGVPLR